MGKVVSVKFVKTKLDPDNLFTIELQARSIKSIKFWLNNTHHAWSSSISQYFNAGFTYLPGTTLMNINTLFDIYYSGSQNWHSFSQIIEIVKKNQLLNKYPEGYSQSSWERFIATKMMIDSLVNEFTILSPSKITEYIDSQPKIEKKLNLTSVIEKLGLEEEVSKLL